MRKYGLKVVTDSEAEDLMDAWTNALRDWAGRHGHKTPFNAEVLHDVTMLATSYVAVIFAEDVRSHFVRLKVKPEEH